MFNYYYQVSQMHSFYIYVFQIGFESARLKKLHVVNDTAVHNCRLSQISSLTTIRDLKR
jgi:hypothetical protein